MIQSSYITPLLVETRRLATCSVPVLVLAVTLLASSPTQAQPLSDPLPDSPRFQPRLANTLANAPQIMATPQASLRLPADGMAERETPSVATQRAAIWPVSGVLLFLAIALASWNTRRGRRTPRVARAF